MHRCGQRSEELAEKKKPRECEINETLIRNLNYSCQQKTVAILTIMGETCSAWKIFSMKLNISKIHTYFIYESLFLIFPFAGLVQTRFRPCKCEPYWRCEDPLLRNRDESKKWVSLG